MEEFNRTRKVPLNTEKYQFPFLLFDSECGLCLRFKQSLEKVPGIEKYQLHSIHDQDIYEVFPFLNKSSCSEEIHLVIDQDHILRGSEALAYLISEFPIVNKFSWLIESGMGKKAVDYFYNMTNKYRRSLLNRCPSCK